MATSEVTDQMVEAALTGWYRTDRWRYYQNVEFTVPHMREALEAALAVKPELTDDQLFHAIGDAVKIQQGLFKPRIVVDVQVFKEIVQFYRQNPKPTVGEKA